VSERARILLLSPLPPPSGGISNWTAAVLASDLAERFELRVASSSPANSGEVAGASRPSLSRALDVPRILGRFVLELARFRPQAVHVNTSFFWGFLRDGAAVWLAKLAGARVLLHLRGGDFPEWVDGLTALPRRLVLATLRRADCVVALTRPTERWLVDRVGTERVRYLPNFVALGAEPAPRDPARRPVELVFVGWRIAAKGVRELLEALPEVPGARLTLIGPEEPSFSTEIAPLVRALGERVRVLPAQPRDEIERAMRAADVFVLPTWREGFPNVVVEAMGAGLPVVATPVGAIPEIVVPEQTGLLVPVRDASALREALARLVANAGLRERMGRAGRARAAELFVRDAVLSHLAAIWSEAHGRPK
jgi:glycosyltransferase involved in cell wall biosynthesis